MKLRTSFIAAAFAVAAVFGVSTGPSVAETLRLAHHHPVGGQLDKTAEMFAQLIKEQTNGELEIKIFPAAQLGQQNEAFELLNQGVIDMTLSPIALMDKEWGAVRVFNLPFVWSGWDHFQAAVDGEFGKQVTEGLLENSNTRLLGMFGFGFRDMIFRREPVRDVAGMAGLKMRSPEARIWISMFQLLGAKPTPVTWGEVYTAMQTGVAAGLEAPALAALDMKFDEVTKSLVRTQHMFSTAGLTINKNRFNKLSPEFQQAVLSAGAEASRWSGAFARAGAIDAYERMEKLGMTIVEPVNPQAWAAAMQPLWEEIATENEGAPELIKLIIAAK